jgi:hypothetical protein
MANVAGSILSAIICRLANHNTAARKPPVALLSAPDSRTATRCPDCRPTPLPLSARHSHCPSGPLDPVRPRHGGAFVPRR